MKITSMQQVSAISVHYVITYKGIERPRFFFFAPNATPVEIAQALADNVNLFCELVDSNGLSAYDSTEHVTGIQADARRYGTD